jgi:hypothetical protein
MCAGLPVPGDIALSASGNPIVDFNAQHWHMGALYHFPCPSTLPLLLIFHIHHFFHLLYMFNVVGSNPTQQLGEAEDILEEASWDNDSFCLEKQVDSRYN